MSQWLSSISVMRDVKLNCCPQRAAFSIAFFARGLAAANIRQ